MTDSVRHCASRRQSSKFAFHSEPAAATASGCGDRRDRTRSTRVDGAPHRRFQYHPGRGHVALMAGTAVAAGPPADVQRQARADQVAVRTHAGAAGIAVDLDQPAAVPRGLVLARALRVILAFRPRVARPPGKEVLERPVLIAQRLREYGAVGIRQPPLLRVAFQRRDRAAAVNPADRTAERAVAERTGVQAGVPHPAPATEVDRQLATLSGVRVKSESVGALYDHGTSLSRSARRFSERLEVSVGLMLDAVIVNVAVA